MSAADRMVVRTGDGSYRSVPRRVALGMIARGRGTAAGVEPVEPHDDEHNIPQVAPLPVDGDPAAPGLEYVSDDVDEDAPTVDAIELPAEPKPSARRGDWADYADSLGVEVTSSMTKTEIQAAAQDAAESLARLPQPAPTGGRLDMPEDEPAAETVADDPDTRTQ